MKRSFDPLSILRQIACATLLVLECAPTRAANSNEFDIPIVLSLVFLTICGVQNITQNSNRVKFLLFIKSPVFISATLFMLAIVCSHFFADRHFYKISNEAFLKSLVSITALYYLPLFAFAFGPKQPSELIPGLYALWAFTFYFSGHNAWQCSHEGFSRLSSLVSETELHKNRLGDISANGGMISIALLLCSKFSPIPSLLFSASMFCGIVSTLTLNSRTALLSIPTTAILAILLRAGKKTILPGLIIATTVLILFAGAMWLIPADRTEKITDAKGASIHSRSHNWQKSLEYLSVYPFNPLGVRGEFIALNGTEPVNPCNFFLQEWIQVGLFGAIAYTCHSVSALIMLGYLVRQCRSSKQLSLISIFAFGAFLEGFMRQAQDSALIGMINTHSTAVGIGLLLYLGLQKAEIDHLNSSTPQKKRNAHSD